MVGAAVVVDPCDVLSRDVGFEKSRAYGGGRSVVFISSLRPVVLALVKSGRPSWFVSAFIMIEGAEGTR